MSDCGRGKKSSKVFPSFARVGRHPTPNLELKNEQPFRRSGTTAVSESGKAQRWNRKDGRVAQFRRDQIEHSSCCEEEKRRSSLKPLSIHQSDLSRLR